MNDLTTKLDTLKRGLMELEGALIAFSGGVDSTFLLKVASEVLADKIIAVTACSETLASKEFDESKRIARSLGVKHIIINTTELDDPRFASNPPDRCYHCKRELFCKLSELAREHSINHIIEGSNVSDIQDYRPGTRAIEEFQVRSPLKEAGLTKTDIRSLSKAMNLSTWSKPSSPCLASRIPYGNPITAEKLRRIELGEEYIRSLGIEEVRVRDHEDVARIEVSREHLHSLVEEGRTGTIVDKFKSLGYSYVSIDLEGYRMGSMNESLKKKHNG